MRTAPPSSRPGPRPSRRPVSPRALAILAASLFGCGGSVSPPPAPPPVPPDPPPIAQDPPLAATAPLAVVNATLIPMTGAGVATGMTVVTRDGLIAAVGPVDAVEVPPDATVIDGRGRFLMPGLADMHVHIATETAIEAGPGQLLLYLANGITTVLNQGDFGGPLPEWGFELRAGRMEGPTLYTARYARGTGDGTPLNVVIDDVAEVPRYVRSARSRGYRFIKVYNFTRPAVFSALAEEARASGMGLIGHVPVNVGLERALSEGLSMVAHAGFGGYYNTYFRSTPDAGRIDGAVALTRDAGAWVNATLAVEEAVAKVWGGNGAEEAAVFSQPGVQYAHPATLARWRTKLFQQRLYHPPGAVPGGRDTFLAFIEGFVGELHEGGVRLLAGSDSPTVLLMAGFSFGNELRLLEESGLSRYEVLEVATKNAGDFIALHVPDLERFGTVEVGRRADLLLLEANPLEDLAHLERRVGVIARGRWYAAQDLDRLLATLP